MSKSLTRAGASLVLRSNQPLSKGNYVHVRVVFHHHHHHHQFPWFQIRLFSSPTSAPSTTSTSTTSSSFFSHTSGRARRRRQRQQARQQQQQQQQQQQNGNDKKNHNMRSAARSAAEDKDTRTVMDILFPNPYKGQKLPDDMKRWRLPTSFSMFRTSLSMAWKDYKSTWKGFASSRGILVETTDVDDETKKETENKTTASSNSNYKKDDNIKSDEKVPSLPEISVTQRGDEMVGKNVKRNVQFLADEAKTIQKKVQDETGINNVEDLKRLAGDMMRLTKDCLNEFMAGYRKGRDDEVDKMLTQYFKELEEEANNNNNKPKIKRRKPKRRVLRRKYYL